MNAYIAKALILVALPVSHHPSASPHKFSITTPGKLSVSIVKPPEVDYFGQTCPFILQKSIEEQISEDGKLFWPIKVPGWNH